MPEARDDLAVEDLLELSREDYLEQVLADCLYTAADASGARSYQAWAAIMRIAQSTRVELDEIREARKAAEEAEKAESAMSFDEIRADLVAAAEQWPDAIAEAVLDALVDRYNGRPTLEVIDGGG